MCPPLKGEPARGRVATGKARVGQQRAERVDQARSATTTRTPQEYAVSKGARGNCMQKRRTKGLDMPCAFLLHELLPFLRQLLPLLRKRDPETGLENVEDAPKLRFQLATGGETTGALQEAERLLAQHNVYKLVFRLALQYMQAEHPRFLEHFKALFPFDRPTHVGSACAPTSLAVLVNRSVMKGILAFSVSPIAQLVLSSASLLFSPFVTALRRRSPTISTQARTTKLRASTITSTVQRGAP